MSFPNPCAAGSTPVGGTRKISQLQPQELQSLSLKGGEVMKQFSSVPYKGTLEGILKVAIVYSLSYHIF
jgi:hypothetical protein